MSKPTGALEAAYSVGWRLRDEDSTSTYVPDKFYWSPRSTPALDDPTQMNTVGVDNYLPIEADCHLTKSGGSTYKWYVSILVDKKHSPTVSITSASSGWQDSGIDNNGLTTGGKAFSAYYSGESYRQPVCHNIEWELHSLNGARTGEETRLNGLWHEEVYHTDSPDTFYYADEDDHLFDQYHFVSAYHMAYLLGNSYNRLISESRDAFSIPVTGVGVAP